jgi:hypothetical protein
LATAEVVLNVEHPSIEKLARIAREQRQWAAYMALKLAGRAER